MSAGMTSQSGPPQAGPGVRADPPGRCAGCLGVASKSRSPSSSLGFRNHGLRLRLPERCLLFFGSFVLDPANLAMSPVSVSKRLGSCAAPWMRRTEVLRAPQVMD
jgi:hypothetical protein